jgi:hypothetical protein
VESVDYVSRRPGQHLIDMGVFRKDDDKFIPTDCSLDTGGAGLEKDAKSR